MMSASSNVNVEALAAKVEQLGQVCAQLSRENAELRGRLSRLPAALAPVASAARPVPARGSEARGEQPERQVSRRMVGKALGAAAAGVVGAAALMDLSAAPAGASTGDAVAAGKTTFAEDPTVLQYDGSNLRNSVLLVNDTTLTAADLPGAAVVGAGGGSGGTSKGVFGVTLDGNGMGVEGNNASQTGSGAGVWGNATSPTGFGVLATNIAGIGVRATSNQGRGGQFSGAAAQVQLVPGSNNTHPTSGHRGDLYADSTGRLWFCKTSGTTATWKQIA
jgi:hypothetical protein